MPLNPTFVARTVGLTAVAALALSGCSSQDSAEKTTTATSAAASSAPATTASKPNASNFYLRDAYVKAAPEGQTMTAAFGTLVNDNDRIVHLSSFTANVKAKTFQIHEVVDGQMKEKKGGFVIPAKSEYELKPGGDHFMIMGLEQPIAAGSKVTITLNLDDGTRVEIPNVPVRAIGAGNESYGDSPMTTTSQQPTK